MECEQQNISNNQSASVIILFAWSQKQMLCSVQTEDKSLIYTRLEGYVVMVTKTNRMAVQ